MFTWICPVCGAEVPPSEAECPRCAERKRAAAAQPAASAGPGQTSVESAPPPRPAPPPPGPPPSLQAGPSVPPSPPSAWPPPQPLPGAAAPAEQPVYVIGETRGRRPVPAWLAAVLTLVVIGGGLFLLYRYLSSKHTSAPAAQTTAPLEAPQQPASSHPFAKYVEVTGVRLLEGAGKKLMARFVVVNHAPAELTGFRLRITLEAANAAPGDAVIAVVEAAPGPIPAHGIKDMEAPLVTPLRVYELPDWQFVRARVEIIDLK